jgi:hypothetical protein
MKKLEVNIYSWNKVMNSVCEEKYTPFITLFRKFEDYCSLLHFDFIPKLIR